MERLKNYLVELSNNNEIKTTNSKIEQRTRNAIRNDFTNLLVEILAESISCDSVVVARTKEGIGIAIDNEKVGFIPIVLKPVFKDTAEDILELAEDYERELAEKKAKAEQQAKAKAEKLAKQKEIAEQKKRLKELESNLE
jgi:hypothetical protein